MKRILATALTSLIAVVAVAVAAFGAAQSAHAATLFQPPNNTSLLVWYTLDEGTGTILHDFSGTGNTSNSSNGSLIWTAGRYNRALQFDGSTSYIKRTAFLNQPTGNAPVTISAWIKPAALTGDRSIACFGQDTSSPNAFGIITRGSNALAGFSSNNGIALGATTLQTGQWYFIVGTYDGSATRVYVNGAQDASAAFSSANLLTGNGINVGVWCNYTTGVNNYNGTIDDVKIYGRALSAAEIAMQYQRGQATRQMVSRNGLVGWWTFDEGTSTVAHDFSWNNDTGTLINNPPWTSGRFGRALSFNGTNQKVTFPNLPVSGTSDLTMSAWVNTAVSGTRKGIFAIGNQTAGQGIMIFINAANQAESDVSGSVGPNSTATVTDGKWHLIGMTKTGTTLQMYVDGVASGAAATLNPNLTSGGTNWIGEDFAPAFFSGSIDDVRVYSHALSAGEMARLYAESSTRIGHSQENVMNNGLVAYWSFNGSDLDWNALKAWDRSGNNNNGILTGLSQGSSPVAGRVGQALTFNPAGGAGQYVYVPTPANVPTGSSPRTYSAWFKLNSATPVAATVVGIGNNGYVGSRFSIFVDNGSCSPSYGIGVESLNSGISRVWTPDTKWHHIAAVFPSGATNVNQTLLYLDGSLMTSATCLSTGATLNTTNDEMTVATTPTAHFVTGFQGTVDEVRIYNRALSTQEIAQLYRLGK